MVFDDVAVLLADPTGLESDLCIWLAQCCQCPLIIVRENQSHITLHHLAQYPDVTNVIMVNLVNPDLVKALQQQGKLVFPTHSGWSLQEDGTVLPAKGSKSAIETLLSLLDMTGADLTKASDTQTLPPSLSGLNLHQDLELIAATGHKTPAGPLSALAHILLARAEKDTPSNHDWEYAWSQLWAFCGRDLLSQQSVSLPWPDLSPTSLFANAFAFLEQAEGLIASYGPENTVEVLLAPHSLRPTFLRASHAFTLQQLYVQQGPETALRAACVPPNMLVLYTDGSAEHLCDLARRRKISALETALPLLRLESTLKDHDYRPLVIQTAQACQESLSVRVGGTSDRCFLSVTARPGHSLAVGQLDDIASTILDDLLLAFRPLAAWRGSFLCHQA